MDAGAIEAIMATGDWDSAIAACRTGLMSTPCNPKIHAYLGMCFFRKGDFANAIEPFRRATLLDPKFWQAGAKLAQCYDRLRRFEEAYSVAKEWIRVQPNDPTLQGLVFALENQVKGNRLDGWERTRGLAHKVTFSSE